MKAALNRTMMFAIAHTHRNLFARLVMLAVVALPMCAAAQQPPNPPAVIGESSDMAQQSPSAAASTAELEFFEKKIRPVLVAHCYECHSAERDAAKGGLRLDTRAAARAGGDSGPAVVPRNVEESLLISALRQESFEMPPSGKLPESVIADFERWIEQGAADPRTGGSEPARATAGIDLEAARDFWSFQPLKHSAPPAVDLAAWPRSAIDHYILARLEQAGLRPGPDADRATLLRRVYFDLIGLPPSPAERDAFLADDSPLALQRVVDRLLSSPHFGERWGRHWLDVVRYADSSGGGRTRIFEDSWRYRDYVLETFNQDRPYDQFLAEQVAGDLLPAASADERARQLTATGFLVLGPTNYELQDKELLRMEVVDEQIDTLGKAVLGMTIGCARCHDHKFDPIPTRDYYALAGIFRSTKTLTPGNVSGFVQTPLPLPPEQQRAREEFERRVAPLRAQLTDAEDELKQLQDKLTGGRDQLDPAALPGIVVDETGAKLDGQWNSSSSVKPFVGDSYHYAAAGQSTARFTATLPAAGRYEVRVSHTANPNRASNVPVTVDHAEGSTRRQVNHRQTPPIDGLFVSLGEFRFDAGPATVTIHCTQLDGLAIADAVQWLPKEGQKLEAAPQPADGPSREELARTRKLMADRQAEVRRLRDEIKTLQSQAPPEPPLVMSVRDEQQTEDYHVCIRGNIRNPGEAVERGFLRVVSDGESAAIAEGESGRRELAQWLASPHNPLTPRVMVNRVWLHLLGEGLVRTPDNFGTTGAAPTHPQLLDYLAAQFVRDGWSIKRLIRRIVLSRVYGLSSQPHPEAEAQDPENRLLARMPHRRLDAESMRDLILTVSGQLDTRYGGPGIPPGTRSEFGFEFEERRRSVYLPVFRNRLHELFVVFDFADPNLVNGRRNTSVLPTQALYLMNSPFLMDQAERAAQRLLAESDSDEQRLERLYLRALGRPPTPRERQLALDYLQQLTDSPPYSNPSSRADRSQDSDQSRRAESQRIAWSTLCQALFASLDFRYLK